MGLCLGVDNCIAPLASFLLLDVTSKNVLKVTALSTADQQLKSRPLCRRQDYLQRLGIQRGSRQPNVRCAPDQLATELPPPRVFAWQRDSRPGHTSALAQKNLQEADEPNEEKGACCPEDQATLPCLMPGKDDDFRVSFLRKLSYHKVWLPKAERPPMHQTVIIFDWDDTLLCTSFLQEGYASQHQTRSATLRHLKRIECAARELLQLALQLGHVFIITNALEGWVEYSAAKFLPGLLPILQRIPVVSARGRFAATYPDQVQQWKVQAFLDVQAKLDSEIITNLVSLGDSDFELDATLIMGSRFAEALTKTIRFHENPTCEELMKELEVVVKKFKDIAQSAKNLRINLSKANA